MVIAQGFPNAPSNKVCKLLKSLYGLKQATRSWFERLYALLLDCGYTQSPSDHSFFIKHPGSEFTTLIVYVDDIVLAGTTLVEFDSLKTTLHFAFGIKDLGVLKFFLGLEAAPSLVASLYVRDNIALISYLIRASMVVGMLALHLTLVVICSKTQVVPTLMWLVIVSSWVVFSI